MIHHLLNTNNSTEVVDITLFPVTRNELKKNPKCDLSENNTRLNLQLFTSDYNGRYYDGPVRDLDHQFTVFSSAFQFKVASEDILISQTSLSICQMCICNIA